jgi:hypothetical protein
VLPVCISMIIGGTVLVPPLHRWYNSCSTTSHGGKGAVPHR